VYPRQYVAQNWLPEQGLPQSSVYDIAQDRNGYLWLATWGGLVRFDGVRFRVFTSADIPALGSGRVMALCATRSGALWVGTRDGSVMRLDHDRVTTYREQAQPGTLIRSIREDRDGNVWINTSGGVARVAGSRLETYAAAAGKAVSEFYLQARDGSTWLQSGNDIVRLAPDGVTSSVPVFKPDGFLLGEARDGSVVIAFNNQPRVIRYHDGAFTDLRLSPRSPPRLAGSYPNAGVLAMATDTDGELLLLTPAGFVRVVDGGLSPPEVLPLDANGDALPKVLSFHVDREGNRWVGTVTTGLYRFRPAPLTAFGRSEGLSDSTFFSIFQDRDRRIWLGGIDSLHWFDGLQFHRFPGLRDIRSIAQTRDGALWFGGSGGLHRWRGGVLTLFRIDAPAVNSIVEDRHGTLWILAPSYDRPGGLFRFRDGSFERVASDAHKVAADRNGALWIALPHGLQHVREGHTDVHHRKLSSVPDLRLDTTGTLWIADYGAGLLRFRDGTFTPITVKHGLPNSFPDALLEDAGSLWVSSDRGVLRFSLKDLNDVADGRISSVVPVSYGVPEGMRSAECNAGGPGVWKTADGRIWFPTVRGVVAVDPDAGVRLPPAVILEEASANTRLLAREQQTSVPPGNGVVDFRFTGLSLFDPEKLRFKYRLDPFDEDWVDAGARRTAHYTNLPPGDYSFRVIAANGFGVWNEKGDTIRFVLRPHYYQTNWFRALCAMAVIGLLYVGYRLRLRRLQHAFEMTLDARVDERTRIARDLHDTLLQGAHGILLRFQTVSHLLPDRPVEAKERLDRAIEQTVGFITEARDEVQGLRGSVVRRNDLATAIDTLGRELAATAVGRPPSFCVTVEGEPRELHPIVRDEIYKIAAEALRNAFRHAHAAHVEVEIRYDSDGFRMRVRDDGQGMDPRVPREGLEGHYGLGGMRERATLIGGDLTVWSEVGAGSEIELCVASAGAYARPGGRSRPGHSVRRANT
jgi:signal transduction histidine kinase/ligand-binding sensor domain-containing protein